MPNDHDNPNPPADPARIPLKVVSFEDDAAKSAPAFKGREVRKYATGLKQKLRGTMKLDSLQAIDAPPSETCIDEPVFAIYNAGKRSNYNDVLGHVLQADVTGCPYRCRFCWVHGDALSAKSVTTTDSPVAKKDVKSQGFLEKHIAALPKALRNKMQTQGFVTAKELYEFMKEKEVEANLLSKRPIDMYTFSGGSPTLYRGGLIEFAKLAKKDGKKVGIFTEGFHIANDPDYLRPFIEAGLEDTVMWYVSMKNATPETFTQLTQVKKDFSESHFIALKKLLENGFMAFPAGLLLDTFATKEQLKLRGDADPVASLHKKLSAIHPELPKLLVYARKITTQVHDRHKQHTEMEDGGYWVKRPTPFRGNEAAIRNLPHNTDPATAEMRLTRHFKDQGTPIMDFSPEIPRIDEGHGVEVIRKIRDELHRKHQFRQASTYGVAV